jgi:threonine dehydrogenase-like Zn-dependent dehydrogenase
MGQTHVHRFLPELLDHIETGRLSPEVIISHRMSLEQAAEGYKIFDKKEEDCRKVILTPGDSHIAIPQADSSATLLTT